MGWGELLGFVLLVLAGVGAFLLAVWLAAQAPLLTVPLGAGAYGLWRWHRRSLAARGPRPTP
jgi:hypothetical protein